MGPYRCCSFLSIWLAPWVYYHLLLYCIFVIIYVIIFKIINMDGLAKVNWDRFGETHKGSHQVDRDDRPIKQTRGEKGRNTLKKLKIDSRLAAQGRIEEYDRILNQVNAGSLSSKDASRQIKDLWRDNKMYLLRGGALGLSNIQKVLDGLELAGIITPEEAMGMLADAKEEKERQKSAEPSLWEQMTDKKLKI